MAVYIFLHFLLFRIRLVTDNIIQNATCKVAEGLNVEGILNSWSKIKPVIMEAWGEDRDALIDLFGKIRDEWMDTDLATWIDANRYPLRIKLDNWNSKKEIWWSYLTLLQKNLLIHWLFPSTSKTYTKSFQELHSFELQILAFWVQLVIASCICFLTFYRLQSSDQKYSTYHMG